MKTAGVILSTYFRIHFFAALTNIVAILFWLIATIMTFTRPEWLLSPGKPQLYLFLVALFNVLSIAGIDLRRLVLTNAGALYPRYRPRHLMVFGMILAVFLVWPVIIICIKGFPVLPAMAMFLFLAAAMILGSFTIGESGLVVIGSLWLGKLMFDMLGIKSRVVLFPFFFKVSLFGSQTLFALLVILVSLFMLFRFGIYFLTVSPRNIPFQGRDASSNVGIYDRTNPVTLKMAGWSLTNILRNTKGEKRTLLQRLRLLQPALFSPGLAFISQSIIMYLSVSLILAMAAYLIIQIRMNESKPVIDYLPSLIFVYLVSAIFVTLDFLQHRHRLPLLWMATPSGSRKQFAGTTFLTYLLVMAKQYLVVSVLLLLLPVFIPALTYFRLLPYFVFGLLIYIIYMSLSILMGNAVRSPDCKGWMIGNMTLGIYGTVFILALIKASNDTLSNTPATWYFIAGSTLFSLSLLGWAYIKWTGLEMNHTGSEPYRPEF